jgi:hypothetical protein
MRGHRVRCQRPGRVQGIFEQRHVVAEVDAGPEVGTAHGADQLDELFGAPVLVVLDPHLEPVPVDGCLRPREHAPPVVGELAPRLERLEVLVATAVEQGDAQARGTEPLGHAGHLREALRVLESLPAHRQLDEEPGFVQLSLEAVEVRSLRGRELRQVHLAAVGSERANELEKRLRGQRGSACAADEIAPALEPDGEGRVGEAVAPPGGGWAGGGVDSAGPSRATGPGRSAERRGTEDTQKAAAGLRHGKAPR